MKAEELPGALGPGREEFPGALRPGPGEFRAAVLAAAALALLTGCTLDIVRTRGGNFIKTADYEKLEVDRTTREEAVRLLGAPDKLEWKSGKDYIWYLYADDVDVGLRFQIPPPPLSSISGYRHNIVRLSEESDVVSSLALVFDEEGVLRQKSLRLSRAYSPPPEDPDLWKLHVVPRLEHTLFLIGDAGVADYSDLFENGYRAGLDFGFQPFPVVTLLGSASFQEHQGDHFRRVGQRIALDDLRIYQLEIGIRLAAPLSLLGDLGDFEKVKRVLFEDDLTRSLGWRFFLQGTTGLAINGDVPVKIDDVPAGDFYDHGAGFTGTVSTGLEYGWRWGAAHLGITYQAMDGFESGNSPLDDTGDGFRSVLVGGGVSFRF